MVPNGRRSSARDFGIVEKKSIIEKRIKREEKQRVMGGKARYIRGKGIKDPIYRAIITNEDGETVEYNDQALMVSVIAESNRIRQQQCIGSPFMTPPLVDIFGHLANEEIALQVINGTFNIPTEVDPVAAALIRKLERPEEIRSKKETKTHGFTMIYSMKINILEYI